jgi:hypothetical protein
MTNGKLEDNISINNTICSSHILVLRNTELVMNRPILSPQIKRSIPCCHVNSGLKKKSRKLVIGKEASFDSQR